MTGPSNIIKALEGDQSLLLILPKHACRELDIANQDWLKFEIKNRELIIKKIDFGDKVLPVTNGGSE
jgi:hypothetical protein